MTTRRRMFAAFITGTLGLLTVATPAVTHAQPPRVEVQAVAATGSMPKGVSLSPDGKHAYVTNFGQENGKNITVYDASTLAIESQIDVPGIVVESVLSPDGSTIYASNFRRDSVQFVDLKTRKVTREVHVGLHPKILVPSPDGKFLFAANWSGQSVTQIEIATGKAIRTLPTTGLNPRGMAMTRAGVLFAANFNGASIDIFKGPDMSDRHTLSACPIPRHLALSPDEKMLFISCYHDSMIHAVDTATEKVVHTLHVGSSEDWTARVFTVPGMDRGSGLTIYPDGKRALVTGWYDDHVYLVGFEGTGGDPKAARAKIDGWIRRPRHSVADRSTN